MPPPFWLSATGPVGWNPRRAKVQDEDDSDDEQDTKNSDGDYDIYHFPDVAERRSNQRLKRLPSSHDRVKRIYGARQQTDKSCRLLQEELAAENQPIPQWQQDENAMIKRFIEDRKVTRNDDEAFQFCHGADVFCLNRVLPQLEIVVLIEGADALTSSSVQARYSYTHRDIVWDHTFASCVSVTDDGCALVNFT